MAKSRGGVQMTPPLGLRVTIFSLGLLGLKKHLCVSRNLYEHILEEIDKKDTSTTPSCGGPLCASYLCSQ